MLLRAKRWALPRYLGLWLQPPRLHLFTICVYFPKLVIDSPPFHLSSHLMQDVGLEGGLASTLLPHGVQGFLACHCWELFWCPPCSCSKNHDPLLPFTDGT